MVELAVQAEMRGVRTEAEWTPLISSFDLCGEVKINLKGQSWPALPQLLEKGQQFHDQKNVRSRTTERRRTEREEEEEEGGQVEVQ